MIIEVTEKTFELIFKGLLPTQSDKKELHATDHFYNETFDQRGKQIFNYVSSVWQYYLIDIND